MYIKSGSKYYDRIHNIILQANKFKNVCFVFGLDFIWRWYIFQIAQRRVRLYIDFDHNETFFITFLIFHRDDMWPTLLTKKLDMECINGTHFTNLLRHILCKRKNTSCNDQLYWDVNHFASNDLQFQNEIWKLQNIRSISHMVCFLMLVFIVFIAKFSSKISYEV